MNNALVVPLGFDEASIITQKNRDSCSVERDRFIQLTAWIKLFHCKFIHTRSLLLTLLFCVSVSLSFGASSSIAAEQSGGSTVKLDRLVSASQFAASSKRVAFPVQASNETVAIYLANHDQTSASKLISERSHLLWPYLSIDGLRLIVVRQFFDGAIYELLSCELDAFNCKVLVRSDRRISSPFELSKGVVLYSASPHAVRMNGRGAYDRNDFWIVDGTGEPRQLTDFEFYELGSISASPGQVYFSAVGPRKDKPILPSMQPLARENSDIFRLPFDSEQLKVAVPDQVLSPLYVMGGLATRPSVSADGSLIAFLRAKTGRGRYRYDLVLAEQRTGQTRTVESSGLGFSRPVVVGTTAFSKEIFETRFEIKSIELSSLNPKVEFQVTDSEIQATETRSLVIK